MQNLENIVASLAATAASLTKLTAELTELAKSLNTGAATNIAPASSEKVIINDAITENVSYDTVVAQIAEKPNAIDNVEKPNAVETPSNDGDLENMRINATQAASRLRQDGIDAKNIKAAVARIGKDTGAVKIGELNAAQISQLLVVFDELSTTV